MRFKILGSFIIIVFFASVATFVTLSKRPFCIDSKIVEKIDRVSNDGTSSVWRCSLNKSIPYDEKFQLRLPEINRKISFVERFFEDVSPLSHHVEIVWLDDASETIRLLGPRIFISKKLLFSTDQLERSLLRIWMREKAGNATIDRTLLEGALVDLVMFSQGHSHEFGKSQLKWPNLLSSEVGTCQNTSMEFSALRTDRYLMCSDSKSMSFDSQSILVGSGRPIITEAFISAYMSLSVKERTLLIKSLPLFLANLDRFSASSLLSEETSVKQTDILRADIEKIETIISDFASNNIFLKAQLQNQNWKIFDHEFRNQMNFRGFSSREFMAQLDYLIQLGSDLVLNQEGMDHFRNVGSSNWLIGVADDQRLMMLPGGAPLQRKIFGLLKARQLIYLSCEIPSTEKLIEFSKIADKLLYVRFCGKLADVNFREYFVQGYTGFAQSNPQLAFIQIHLPSLFQAWNGHSGNPLPALARQDWQNPFFAKVGWQAPTWDDSIKIYRTRSVIQAIEAYRPLSN